MTNNKEEKRRKREYSNRMLDLKFTFMLWGFHGIFYIWIILFLQMTSKNYGPSKLQNNPEKQEITGVLSETVEYFDQFHNWMPVVAAVLITLTWLFDLVALCCLSETKQPKLDAFFHLVAAIILVVAALFLIAHMTIVYHAACGENGYVTQRNNEIKAMNNNKTGNDGVKWSEFSCPAAVFVITTSVPSSIHYEKKDIPGSVAFREIFFLVLVFPVLIQIVQCIRIFLLAKNRKTSIGPLSSPAGGKGDDKTLSISSHSSCDSGL